jgi:DNA-binding MarR family transcriptional regulator
MGRDVSKQRKRAIGPEDYEALAEFRHGLRRFLTFSEEAAREHGLTAQQHQAILAIKGSNDGKPAAVGVLAERLLIRHHSAVELVDRLERAGLVTRLSAEDDRRLVLVALTAKAEAVLEELSAAHLDELKRSRELLARLLDRLDLA